MSATHLLVAHQIWKIVQIGTTVISTEKLYGPAHKILVLIAVWSNEGSDEAAQNHSLLRSHTLCMDVDSYQNYNLYPCWM